jgi:beta-lactamase regulating signal transducer with metallopeptidase domain
MILATFVISIPSGVDRFFPEFVSVLAGAAVRALAVAGVAACALFVTRSQNLAVKLPVWKAVLAAALAMPVLAMCLPATPVAIPGLDRLNGMFPASRPAQSPVAKSFVSVPTLSQPNISSRERNERTLSSAAPTSTTTAGRSEVHRETPWQLVAASVYALVAVLLSVRFMVGWFLSRRLRHESLTIFDSGIVAKFDGHGRIAGLRSIPGLAESDRLAVPLTCGVLHPAILLPSDWRSWNEEKLDAVLVHELSHVARRDALTERLALLHRIAFWFSPLAWWLRRHLVDLAEEASDQAAIAAGMDRTKYAEILLGFLADLNSASVRVEWQGVAMAQPGRAEKRLDRILSGRTVMLPKMRRSFAVLSIFAGAPIVLIAASLQPQRLGNDVVLSAFPSAAAADPITWNQSASPVAPAPPVSTAPAPSPLPHPASLPSVAPLAHAAPAPLLALAPVPSVPRLLPMSALPPVPQQSSSSSSADHGDRYLVFTGNGQTMSGSYSDTDFAEIQALSQSLKTDFIWFKRDGKSYVITDPALVTRAQALSAAQSELGVREGELGEKEGSLGELQSALGEGQGALGEQLGKAYSDFENYKIEIPDMTQDLQKINDEAQQLAKAETTKEMEQLREQIKQMADQIKQAVSSEAIQKQIAAAEAQAKARPAIDSSEIEAIRQQIQASMNEQMAKIAAAQEELGKQQAKMGAEQAELGRRQAEAAEKGRKEMRAIIDEAVARGAAKPAPKP